MLLSDLDYAYPTELVAQEPLAQRESSRLLVVKRDSGACHHHLMRDLPALLAPGDLLVCNDSRVLPMRLRGMRDSGASVEVLLIEDITGGSPHATWRALTSKMKRLRVGDRLTFASDVAATVLTRETETLVIQFNLAPAQFRARLETIGEPPLPPYITRAVRTEDRARYQTIFAKHDGSAAAPTAGLHFSDALFAACRARGINIAYVTLHVGLDTFQPIRVEDLTAHQMHGEYFSVPIETREAIANTGQHNGRIIAVGTTTVRALESMATFQRSDGVTQLFITPGYAFKIVNGMITNFHQPRTTLLALVAAFAGREHLLAAYREAIAQRYRLFSYGDGMFIR